MCPLGRSINDNFSSERGVFLGFFCLVAYALTKVDLPIGSATSSQPLLLLNLSISGAFSGQHAPIYAKEVQVDLGAGHSLNKTQKEVRLRG